MKVHYFYILYSKKLNRFYIGETPSIENRLVQHNRHYFKKSFTKAAKDWELKLSYCCQTRKEALFLERFTKRMKSSVFNRKVIDNPNILTSILEEKGFR